MAIANVYLNFNGNCEVAFNFYKSVFGGEFSYLGKFKDMPKQEGQPELGKEESEKIMHVSLPISNETLIMGSDIIGEWAKNFITGNNFSVSITAETKKEADRFFSELSAGGNVTMPMDNTFWGDYFGMCIDKFGINWMISYSETTQK